MITGLASAPSPTVSTCRTSALSMRCAFSEPTVTLLRFKYVCVSRSKRCFSLLTFLVYIGVSRDPCQLASLSIVGICRSKSIIGHRFTRESLFVIVMTFLLVFYKDFLNIYCLFSISILVAIMVCLSASRCWVQ